MICGLIPNHPTCLTIMHQFVQTATDGDPYVESLWCDYAENPQTNGARFALATELGMRTPRLDRIFHHLHRLSLSTSGPLQQTPKIEGAIEKKKSTANGNSTFPLNLTWKIQMHERIGSGGFGYIHRATHRFSGRSLAIKTLSSGKSLAVLEEVARHHRLIQILSCRPDYPSSLCRVEDVLEIGGRFFILMEYCDGLQFQGNFVGHDLFEFLKVASRLRERITEEKIRDFSLQIARGAAYLLEEGIFHSDIRPENILLRGNGTAALTDFDGLIFAGSSPQFHLKVPVEFAPEQWENEIESGENEGTLIWSLGLLLFNLMFKKSGAGILKQKLEEESGEQVDDLTLLIALWRKVMSGEWGEFLESQTPENYSSLRTLAASALAYDPAHRPTLAKWVAGLEGI